MKKIITIVVIIIILIVIGVVNKDKSEVSENPLKIGAILALSGPTAIWGEQTKAGIELALEELREDGINMEVVYEDSQANPAIGISSYNKLVSIDKVDVITSMFSRVTIPLIERLEGDEIPLVTTMFATVGAVDNNPWAYRVFHTAAQTGGAHLDTYVDLGFKKVGILYVNDPFGLSNLGIIKEGLEERGIELVEQAYLPTDTDYRTQLSKIKSSGSEALIFVGIPPSALANSITQSRELGLDLPIFEPAGILQNGGGRGVLGELAEGVYTISNPFDYGETGKELRKNYSEKHGNVPGYAVSFAYDTVMIIAEASDGGKYTGEELIERLSKMKSFSGANSKYDMNGEGEINPVVYPARVVNGVLEKI